MDRRKNNALRKIKITTDYLKNACGSCLVEMGDTKVICSATLEDKVPHFLKNKGKGWITAEYGMLPASCNERVRREATRGKQTGRTHEIQRLIGRSIRAVVDLTKLGERTIWLDADVLQGDGGTRTAAITGCFIATMRALKNMKREGLISENPVLDYVAAVSVGIVEGEALLDLCYSEDVKAEVDMNVVMTGSGKFVEVQGTAEGKPFSGPLLNRLLTLGKKGVAELITIQKKHT